MLTFTNLTPEEFLHLNAESLPPEVLKYLDEFSTKIAELEEEIDILRKSDELAWEQVSFARDLIQEIDAFAENNLLNDDLEMYNQIRENSYFEVLND